MKKIITREYMIRYVVAGCLLITANSSHATEYFVSNSGNDSNSGTSTSQPWKTIGKINAEAANGTFVSGDRIRLRRGHTWWTGIHLQEVNGVMIQPYGSGALPRISGNGSLAAIQLSACNDIEIRYIQLDNNMGQAWGSAVTERFGILIQGKQDYVSSNYSGFTMEGLKISKIYATQPTVDSDTGNPSGQYHQGKGVFVGPRDPSWYPKDKLDTFDSITIDGCEIFDTGHAGISLATRRDLGIKDILVENNTIYNIGNSGFQPSKCENVIFRDNLVNNSGSIADPKQFGRGSGTWPFASKNVLIQNNDLMGARAGGKNDSCGVHIDYLCENVIVEYNFSYDNEGGFCEILGGCESIIYRYNVSVDDGWRNNMPGDTANPKGKLIFLSDYLVGHSKNIYIYNNTIYATKGSRAVFAIEDTQFGDSLIVSNLMIKNNIFYVAPGMSIVNGGTTATGSVNGTVVFSHNLYNRSDMIPTNFPIYGRQGVKKVGNPLFQNPSPNDLAGFYPTCHTSVVNFGYSIMWALPGEQYFTTNAHIRPTYDILGKLIDSNDPDAGAFEK